MCRQDFFILLENMGILISCMYLLYKFVSFSLEGKYNEFIVKVKFDNIKNSSTKISFPFKAFTTVRSTNYNANICLKSIVAGREPKVE
jgi:hypothetical protein